MITLPHSGLAVPHTDLYVTDLREIELASGVAYTAVLAHAGRVVGTAENDGHGGETVYMPGRVESGPGFTARDMEAFAAQCRVGGQPVTVSDVLDSLIDEYDFGRSTARAAERGRTLARMVVDERYPINVVEVEPPTAEGDRDVLIARLAAMDLPSGARWELWDGHHWITLFEAPE